MVTLRVFHLGGVTQYKNQEYTMHHEFIVTCEIRPTAEMGGPKICNCLNLGFKPHRSNSIYRSTWNLEWKSTPKVRYRMPNLAPISIGVGTVSCQNSKFGQICSVLLIGTTPLTDHGERWLERADHKFIVVCRISPQVVKRSISEPHSTFSQIWEF